MKCRFFVLAGIVCLFLAVFATSPAQAQTFETLYTFTGISPDGANPYNDPLLDVNGTLYGTTSVGGVNGLGTVYKLNSEGKETVLYSFCSASNCADGYLPQSNVLQDGEGNLYGVTLFGGNTTATNCISDYGCGVVYKLDASGNETVLYTFTGGTDGNIPQGSTMDSAGNLYGITFNGGDLSCTNAVVDYAPGCGVVYKVDKRGKETVLYSFTGGTDGAIPEDYVTLDWAGNIYGVTLSDGNTNYCSPYGCGTVFKLDTRGKLTTLHTFTGSDGALANGSLVLDAWGNLYGTTGAGGDLSCDSAAAPFAGCGVIFEITAAGTYKVLHTFTGPDGADPAMGLLEDWYGNFYGETEWGGNPADCPWSATVAPTYPPGCGLVFKLDARGHETTLYTFTGLADGASPGSALIMDNWGNLYGNTTYGGDYNCTTGFYSTPATGCGVVYKLEEPWR